MDDLSQELGFFLISILGVLSIISRLAYSALETIKLEQLYKFNKKLATDINHYLFSLLIVESLLWVGMFWIFLEISLHLSPAVLLPRTLIFLSVLLVVGNIIPGTVAKYQPKGIIAFLKKWYDFAYVLCYPLLFVVFLFEKKNGKTASEPNFSMEDFSSALDMASMEDEAIASSTNILKEAVKFGEIETSAVMKPRVDIVGAGSNTPLSELIRIFDESGYSRIPIYEEDLDHIIGILYIKDLLQYVKEDDNFNWVSLVRPVIFIPETKKIDMVLKELQEKKQHLAIVVDEYGGSSGLITMEDILEELVGEINDELDSVDTMYEKKSDNVYLFDARMPIHDVVKVLGVEEDFFDYMEGDFESLGGFVLEYLGRFPVENEEIKLKNFTFLIKEVDQRRIKYIQLTIEEENGEKD